MKKFITILIVNLVSLSSVLTVAQTNDSISADKNNWGGKLIKSPFGIGLDIQTKYIWRGMEMMPEESAPVLFPSANYSM